MNNTKSIKGLFFLAIIGAAPAVPAATYTWTGGGEDVNWSTPANWGVASGYPGANAADVAYIKKDAGIDCDGDYTFATLYVGITNALPPIMTLRGTGGASRLDVRSQFHVGSTTGSVPAGELHLEDMDVEIGTEAVPVSGYLGYGGGNYLTRSVLSLTNGRFNAWWDKLYIGYNGSTRSDIGTNRIDLSSVDGGSWRVSGDAYIAYGQPEIDADVLLGEDWTVSFGTEGKPVFFRVAYSIADQHNKVATWEQKSGSFTAHFADFCLGYAAVNAPARVEAGVMHFGAGTDIDITTSNMYFACGNDSASTGRLDAASTENGKLTVLSKLQLANQSNGSIRFGEILLGTNWSVRIGSQEAPAAECGFSVPTGDKASTSYQSLFHMEGGRFEAYCTNFIVAGLPVTNKSTRYNCTAQVSLLKLTNAVIRASTLVVGEVARNWGSGCTAYGTLDLGDATNVCLDIGVLRIGCTTYTNYTGFAGSSVYRTGSGEGTVGTLTIGNGYRSDHAFGLFELNGMRLAVTNGLTLGKNGTLTNNVCGVSSGLALSGEEPPTIAGKMMINFARNPDGWGSATESTADSIRWGFKWAGNHVDEVNALVSAGKINWDVSALEVKAASATGVFYDTSTKATYVGYYMRKTVDGTFIRIF